MGSAGAICCSVVDDVDDDDDDEEVEVRDVTDSALSPPPFFWHCSSFADVAVLTGEHCSNAGPRCTQENRV